MAKNPKIEKIIKAADKTYGEGTIILASEYPELPRLSTGIFGLDRIWGGGAPKGRSIILTGNESTAKTASALHLIREGQNTCRECMTPMIDGVCPNCEDGGHPHTAYFCDVEGTFEKPWAKSIGVDLKALYLSQAEFSEQVVDLMEAMVRTGEVDILVLDSIAMMTPSEEVKKSAEDQIMGTHAKLVNRMLRSIQAGLNSLGMYNKKKPIVILINQVREKVGVNFGNPEVMPGGRGQKFAASIITHYYSPPSNVIYETGGKKKAVGMTVRAKTVKNKTYPPRKEANFDFYVDDSAEYGMKQGQVDNAGEVASYAEGFGLVEVNGSWYTYESDNFKVKGQGTTNFAIELRNNPEAYAELKARLLEEIYRVEVEEGISV